MGNVNVSNFAGRVPGLRANQVEGGLDVPEQVEDKVAFKEYSQKLLIHRACAYSSLDVLRSCHFMRCSDLHCKPKQGLAGLEYS